MEANKFSSIIEQLLLNLIFSANGLGKGINKERIESILNNPFVELKGSSFPLNKMTEDEIKEFIEDYVGNIDISKIHINSRGTKLLSELQKAKDSKVLEDFPEMKKLLL